MPRLLISDIQNTASYKSTKREKKRLDGSGFNSFFMNDLIWYNKMWNNLTLLLWIEIFLIAKYYKIRLHLIITYHVQLFLFCDYTTWCHDFPPPANHLLNLPFSFYSLCCPKYCPLHNYFEQFEFAAFSYLDLLFTIYQNQSLNFSISLMLDSALRSLFKSSLISVDTSRLFVYYRSTFDLDPTLVGWVPTPQTTIHTH